MYYFKQIEVEELDSSPDQYCIIDVRTSAEFGKGSIRGSINIPLFQAEERERIGTIYKKNAQAARFLAMDIISPKISKFVRRVYRYSQEKTPALVCWRGGMRSHAAVDLVQLAGIDAVQVHGGYKRYRQYIYNLLKNYQLNSQVVVLKGKSGTGKTELLHHLRSRGYPVLDLEGLAGHRGSTFGGFEGEAPATQKNFDSELLAQLRDLEGNKYILVEGESKRIGNIYLPEFLFSAMRTAPIIVVDGSLEKRVERIVQDYVPKTHAGRINMYRALARLRHRLSKANFAKLKSCLDQEDYAGFVHLVLLEHYDETYDHQLPGTEVLTTVNSDNIKRAAQTIGALIDAKR